MADNQNTSLKEIEKTSKTEEQSEKVEETPTKVETKPVEMPPPAKKRFRIPFFGKKSKLSENLTEAATTIESGVKAEEDKPITPVELVNNLDGDIKVLTQTKIDELTKELDKQIEEIGKPQVTVSLTKKTILVSMGLILGMMWAVLLGQFVIQNQVVAKMKAKFSKDETTVIEATESATPEKEVKSASASAKSVRIKDQSNKSQEVRDLATMLESNGYEYVEIVEDETLTETKVTVLTKKETDDQVPILSDLLKDLYLINQGVSELTADSDFGVVILFPDNPERR